MADNGNRPLQRMVYASMFGALTAIGAFIVIPVQPVPITLQTLFTGLASVLLGGYGGAWSQIVYILLGIIGLPVFAGGKAGIGTLLGPTGGYLTGFVVAAWVIGTLVQGRRKPGWPWIVFALVIGDVIIYTLGTMQLMMVAQISLGKALLVGVLPFLPGDLVKLAAASLLALKLRKNFQR
ncbi:MAG TPA: biotin transporter BioY [Syntrophomonadaceae bacterium]|nr:biotin transporter BioY [Syntrophomonadaceae bacterium]